MFSFRGCPQNGTTQDQMHQVVKRGRPMEIDKSKPYPLINSLECKSCGRCVDACPKKVLSIGNILNSRGYKAVVYAGEGCIGCATCFYTCPEPHALEIHIPAK